MTISSDDTNGRQRLVQWDDPMATAQAAFRMSGLAFLQAMQRREVPGPPIAHLIGFDIAEVEAGRVVFTTEPAEYHYNPVGAIHGGLGATLLDSALACAILTMLPAGVGSTTIELHINYVRPLSVQTGKIFATGEVIHSGRTIATAQGRITDAAGKLYAHATTTCLILRPEGGG